MARLHSRKKGKSGTKRPKSQALPEWFGGDAAEIKEQILKLAKEGTPSSKIGLYLRDQMGVPNVRAVLGCSLTAFLRKEDAAPDYPEDLLTLMRKAARMQSHMKSNKKDCHNKVKLTHVESKINRLVKYYLDRGLLPKGWKYTPEQAALVAK
jgi:small subunit ribosomal protein S15